jgi:hypothetical protein
VRIIATAIAAIQTVFAMGLSWFAGLDLNVRDGQFS